MTWFAALGIVLSGAVTAHAQDLPPLALFSRCYGQLTGRPVPLNHPLFAQVKSGQVDPIEACMSIFNKANLDVNGRLARTTMPTDVVTLNDVRNTLNQNCIGCHTGQGGAPSFAAMSDVSLRGLINSENPDASALIACPRDGCFLMPSIGGPPQAVRDVVNRWSQQEKAKNGQAGYDIEGLRVLNRIYNFNRSWFSTVRSDDIPEHSEESGSGTDDIFDATEPALALTYNVFTQNAHYSDVLKYGFGFRALREENLAMRNRFGFTVSTPTRGVHGNYFPFAMNRYNFRKDDDGNFTSNENGSDVLTFPAVQVGDLVGAEPQHQVMNIMNFSMNVLAPTQVFARSQEGLNSHFNPYESFGGGIIGLPIYLMMNMGHGKGLVFDGARKLPRRWTFNSMKTFTCTQFPALREGDFESFVVPGSDVPFRQATACVRCHGTLDQAASVGRNMVLGANDYSTLNDPKSPFVNQVKMTELVSSFRAELPPSAGWPAAPVENFHRQTPTGQVYFRSVNGDLVNKNVIGFAGFGAALTETDDFYQCAVKRYFEFFTGINVALYDRGDNRFADMNKLLSTESIEDRRFVEDVAADFRSHQSVPKMIRAILESKYEKSKAFRP